MLDVVFVGGPVDGAVRSIRRGPDGNPPPMLRWRADGLFAGASGQPAPPGLAAYQLWLGFGDGGLRWVYRYMDTWGG